MPDKYPKFKAAVAQLAPSFLNREETVEIACKAIEEAGQKGARLIAADPRRIDLVRFAHLWLQQRPGTDVALLNSMMHVILKEGLEDREFIKNWTEGFEEFKNSLSEFTPEVGEKITGVPKDKIIEAALLYGNAERPGIYYTMGITQHTHGTDNVYSIANLALMTGNLGKEFSGVNPLRGQNNVQGSTDMGCSPNLYPGYQRVDMPAIKEKFERAWGVKLSDKIGLTATEMIDAAIIGNLKAMYIMGENPVLSDPDVNHTIKALKKLQRLTHQPIAEHIRKALAEYLQKAEQPYRKDETQSAQRLLSLAGVCSGGSEDLADRHDEYLYGKRQ
jgi:predicted molibdopterin-dependent oxidoreductase YjgC